MRFIVFDKDNKRVKSVSDLPFEYAYLVQEGDELITGYEDYTFNLMNQDYIFNGINFTEVSKT